MKSIIFDGEKLSIGLNNRVYSKFLLMTKMTVEEAVEHIQKDTTNMGLILKMVYSSFYVNNQNWLMTYQDFENKALLDEYNFKTILEAMQMMTSSTYNPNTTVNKYQRN